MALGLLATERAYAADTPYPVDLPDGPLAVSLHDLARQSGAEMLYDPDSLRDVRVPRIHASLSVEATLQRLLAGTDLVSRRATSGAWVVEQQARTAKSPPPDLAAPEILVVGRRSQDADIRRREIDIQPYEISTGEEIVDAHRDNLDQFFQSRITANTTVSPPSLGAGGNTGSSINLRALGSSQTLILVDGRRLPGVPESIDLAQPDINPIPLHAIDRVETLTGTAGGTYGLDALGGVVNVVLRHDYHGIELHATSGISARGDAKRLVLEGGIGFTPDDGRTDISLYASRSWQQPLLRGQRDLSRRGTLLAERFAPDYFAASPPTSNSTAVVSVSGETLVLKPEYGGASLGSSRSLLPPGFKGTPADVAVALQQHAGQLDLGLSTAEAQDDLASTPHTASLIADLRHRFGDDVEVYFDALLLRDRGQFRESASSGEVTLSPKSPLNPFQTDIAVSFPGPPADEIDRILYSTERYTGGVIVDLPLRWRANTEAVFGASRYDQFAQGSLQGSASDSYSDLSGVTSLSDIDGLRNVIAATGYSGSSRQDGTNHYREQSLRLAGPLFRTAAGPTTLTMLLQNRTETVPVFKYSNVISFFDPPGYDYDSPGISNRTRSAYGEIEAPLIARDAAGITLLRGLTVQLAFRYDRRRIDFTSYPDDGDPVAERRRFSGAMYTLGAKFYPVPWLMVRGSYATGAQPPSADYLTEVDLSEYLGELVDPKRGNVAPITDDSYLERIGGADIRQIRARTLAVGVVLNPDGDHGPRLSIDYSRTVRTGDVTDNSATYILAHEDIFPGRVIRAPLTDADRAKGYTGGVVIEVDARGLSLGRLLTNEIDARLDWRLPFAGGVLRLYGSATRQIHTELAGPSQFPIEEVGYQGGPLKWRANGGGEWKIGPTSVGANLQYFGRYRAIGYSLVDVAYLAETAQGSKYVKAQAYLDLYASRRFTSRWAGADHPMSVDVGVINLFDHMPSYEALSISQYSHYGDPRQRRFELTLNAGF